MKLTAKTFAGLENLLKTEIESLGGTNVQEGRRVVTFEGDSECLYSVLYQSRYALTVLRPIWKFKASDEHDAYRKAFACDWARYLDVDQTFAISPTVYSSIFTHSQYISLKMKDAICDRFRKNMGRRPSVDTEYPDIKFDLYVHEDEFVISLDAAGDALYKRGYRREGHQAPMNEVLAAGIIGLIGWNGENPLYDGMCGTGTLGLEAAMKVAQIPAQSLRRNWACMNWQDYSHTVWKEMVEQAKSKIKPAPEEPLIYGSDIMRSAVFTAHRSANLLDIGAWTSFNKVDFFKLKPEGPSTLVLNPPYGERMGKDIEEMYKNIGDRLKSDWQGSSAYILSGNLKAFKSVGLRTTKKIPLYNGPIECRLCQYDMW